MNSALIIMTILGCNDAGTDCHYIATVNQRWPTIEMCDSVSEKQLPSYTNAPYPVLIAVCQNPETIAGATPTPTEKPATAPATADAPQPPTPIEQDVSQQEKETLAGRAIQRVRNVLPTTEGVKTLMNKPVRLVEDGYSWVARRFER
jgi:hypothetical protein